MLIELSTNISREKMILRKDKYQTMEYLIIMVVTAMESIVMVQATNLMLSLLQVLQTQDNQLQQVQHIAIIILLIQIQTVVVFKISLKLLTLILLLITLGNI